MLKEETQFWDWIIRHRLKLIATAATLFSLYARYALRGLISMDMSTCLLPWYESIRSLGGLRSLSTQIGNYNIPYQTLIGLMTYLPVKPEYAYKALSILFDYALSITLAIGVYEISRDRFKSVLTYTIAINLPIMVLNSAAWGQCDSIFTFFIVAAFVCLLKEKHTTAFLMYGCSLAFKLQAVFFLPFLLFYYVWSRKISFWRFLLLPFPSVVLSAGALVQGRNFWDILSIYSEQTGIYARISLNYPTFWNLLVANNMKDGRDHYSELYRYCMLLTVLVLALLMIWLIMKKPLSRETLALTATVMMYTCVIFLPAMHERYAFPVLIFALFICFLYPYAIPAALGILVIDLQTYGQYLFYHETMPWEMLILINLICYAGLVFLLIKTTAASALKT